MQISNVFPVCLTASKGKSREGRDAGKRQGGRVDFIIGAMRVREEKRKRGKREGERDKGKRENAPRVPGKPMILKEGREDAH